MIVFLGAPSARDVLKTWKGHKFPQDEDISSLRPFEIDPLQRTPGAAWRRLTDPQDSLFQELAKSTVESSRLPDLFLERSLEIFTNEYYNDDNDDDIMDFEYSDLSISQVSTPFLTTYDFDVNEITELEDLPEPDIVAKTLQRRYSIIVAITDMSPYQYVTTKYGNAISFVKLIVADQSKANLEIACWENMARAAQNMRINDIIYFRGNTP